MATLDLEMDAYHHTQFRYRELADSVPPDVIMVPIGGHGDVVDEPDSQFASVIQEAERAIDSGIHPELIYTGSSGSYFIRDTKNVR